MGDGKWERRKQELKMVIVASLRAEGNIMALNGWHKRYEKMKEEEEKEKKERYERNKRVL